MTMTTYTIGKSTDRIDAEAKVTGKAVFGDDVRLDNMLYCKGVYAEYAHAKILAIDTSEAEKMPGVACVVTAKDIPGEKMIGEIYVDQYPIADDMTRYLGDVVAVVAADTQEQANEAAKKVKVSYEPLPVLTVPETAIGNEQVINPDYPDNICGGVHALKGDIEKSLSESDVVVKSHYETQFVEHAYIEPEAVTAIPSPMRPEVTVLGTLQAPYNARISIHRCLNVPMSQIILRPSAIGGSFGGKIETAEAMSVRASLIALKTGRPAHYKLTREESIIESYKRHPINFDIELGADKDGYIKGLKVRALGDCGAYINMSPPVAYKVSCLGPGPYRMDSLDYDCQMVITNNNHTGSMRGFGTPQAIFALENTMDTMAERIGISPLEIRRRNLLSNGDISPCGQKLDFNEVSIRAVMEKAVKAIDYEKKYELYKEQNKDRKRRVRRGVGIATSMRGASIGGDGNGFDVSRVLIEVLPDGNVHVNLGLVEIGQGLRTTQAMMAAEGMGVSLDHVTMGETDTSRSPVTGACIASRGTFVGGAAIKDSCEKIHKIMADAVAKVYKKPVDDIVFENNRVRFADMDISFQEAVDACYACDVNVTPMAVGTYYVPVLNWDGHTGDPFYTYTYSCHVAEVEVDLDCGTVEVIQMVGCHDMGRAINPIMADGQIYGGMAMAEGMAIFEDLGLDRKTGRLKNTNYENYIIPTAMDVPENIALRNENPDPRSAFGGHSLGEPATEPGVAAITCAINMALGKAGCIHSLPADIDRVFFAGQELFGEKEA